MAEGNTIVTGYFLSPLGAIEIMANEAAVLSVKFLEGDIPGINRESQDSDMLSLVIRQLGEYFEGNLKVFDIPLQPEGSDFQQKVWAEIRKIPYGQTISYTEVASHLGSGNLLRAVGNANGHNPVGIIIPCHRVIGKQGDLVGYSGGLWRKQWLLEHEGCQLMLPFS